jgi:hypothetical protein
MGLNLFLFKIKISDFMGIKEGKSTSTPVAQTRYSTRTGIKSSGNENLYSLRAARSSAAPYLVLNELSEGLELRGVGYCDPIGLMIEASSIEDAKQKMEIVKNRKVSMEDLKKLEEGWIKQLKTELQEKKEKFGDAELEKCKIPEYLKEKLVGKTAPEAIWGLEISYEEALKGLK